MEKKIVFIKLEDPDKAPESSNQTVVIIVVALAAILVIGVIITAAICYCPKTEEEKEFDNTLTPRTLEATAQRMKPE